MTSLAPPRPSPASAAAPPESAPRSIKDIHTKGAMWSDYLEVLLFLKDQGEHHPIELRHIPAHPRMHTIMASIPHVMSFLEANGLVECKGDRGFIATDKGRERVWENSPAREAWLVRQRATASQAQGR